MIANIKKYKELMYFLGSQGVADPIPQLPVRVFLDLVGAIRIDADLHIGVWVYHSVG